MPVSVTLPDLSPANRAFLARRAKGQGLLIAGEWREAEGARSFATLDPATGLETGRIAQASAADVDQAVAAAAAALPAWRATVPVQRAQILWKIAELIEANIDDLAQLETLDQGKPLFVGRWAEIPGAANQFRFLRVRR
jgi:phenylacetaldehyde dehydrogenase